jgi:hypothetical protein
LDPGRDRAYYAFGKAHQTKNKKSTHRRRRPRS